MVKYYYRDIKSNKAQELTEFKVGCWVDAQNPTEEELKRLSQELGLEQGYLRDAVDPYEVPHLETENGAVYIFTRFPHDDGKSISTSPVLVVVAETFIATISPKTPFFIERLREKQNYTTTQKVKLLFFIISEINNSYTYYLNQISKQIRRAEVKLEKIDNRDIMYFVTLEGIVNDFRPSLMHINVVLESLIKGKKLPLYEDDEDLLEDIILSNKQLVEIADDNIRTIVNIRNAHNAIMTNNLNRVIKLLTSLAVILTVPMIMASLYGMNVRLPFGDNPFAFFIVISFSLVLILAIIWVFIKKDFL